uniref:DUF7803 domain-containing protein n=1 Tax=Oryza punctata TaxID=4537 RepID=A0A0E0JF29_ORYPU
MWFRAQVVVVLLLRSPRRRAAPPSGSSPIHFTEDETMEETILVGDDLMRGPSSPVTPKEIASHVLEGVELCDGLQINDIEPFCQDKIVLYRQCAEKRDKEIREKMQDSEYKLGISMPLEEAKERTTQLQLQVTLLERRMILASGLEGMEGFRQRWSLHGQLEDTRKRMEALGRAMEKRGSQNSQVQGTTSGAKRTCEYLFAGHCWWLWDEKTSGDTGPLDVSAEGDNGIEATGKMSCCLMIPMGIEDVMEYARLMTVY